HGLHEYGEAVIAAFTAVLAISTILLWRSTDRLWEAGERQIKVSRSAAAVQARSARRQLKHAEDVAQRQLRAYVIMGITDMPRATFDVGAVISVNVRIENRGQTPAYKLRTNFRSDVFDYPFPEGYDFTLPDTLNAS